MVNKIFRVFRWLKLTRLAVGVKHLTVMIRRFARSYALPLLATILLLMLVIAGLYVRDSERITIATISESLNSEEGNYGKLLSNDKTRGLTTEDDASSFSVNTNRSNSTGAPSTSDPGSSPFTATIAFFNQVGVTTECSKPKPKAKWCTKIYTFLSGVSARNGPGTVNYGWRSSLSSVTGNGSTAMKSGDSFTSLQKTVSLPCSKPTTFTLQFIIRAPSLTQSAVKTINHKCDEL